MRNFRKAALAGATAVAVAFGSTAVATAETEKAQPENSATAAPTRTAEAKDNNGQEPGSATRIGHALGVWEKDKDGNVQLNGTDGRALFGSSTDSETQNGGNWGDQPTYAKAGYILSIFTAVSAVVGLDVGPLYNYFVHGDFNF